MIIYVVVYPNKFLLAYTHTQCDGLGEPSGNPDLEVR